MNWRRGLFRLWLLVATLFVIAVAAISYSDIKAEFAGYQTFEITAPDGQTLEVKAPNEATARGVAKKLAESFVPGKPLTRDNLRDFADFVPAPNPWARVETVAAIAFGVPLVVLILGALLVWAFSGFAAAPKQ